VQYPIFITDNKIGIHKDKIDGVPRIGVSLEEVDGRFKVTGNNTNVDCPGGVCPVR